MKTGSVIVEPGMISHLAGHLAPCTESGRLFVVADVAAWRAHGARLLAGLATTSAEVILIESGEDSKSWPQLIALTDQLLAKDIGRSDTVVAFGGGVVGDLAGFAAAIVKRGVRLVHMPTTLLAQVDSSIGGKTAINVAAGKNLIGAFHPPDLVLIDPELLATLDPRHVRAGYAEIVKYALIDDPAFFAWLEDHGRSILSLERRPLLHAIRTSIAAKARIVEGDEHDTRGRRALLNLGHTFGHALEAATGFSDRLLHGEAVAIGMVQAFGLSVRRGLCPVDDFERVESHLASAGLPVAFDADVDRLAMHMRQDKKREGDRTVLILVRGIGRAFVERAVAFSEVETFLRTWRAPAPLPA